MAVPTFHNTLSGEKEVFAPADPAHVRLYACGPTVYSYAHLGNARMAVVFDLLSRLLRRIYPRVTYVSNITDVDDKIMAAAAQSGEAIESVTRTYERIYNEDMAALNVAAPDVQPRATEHIQDMIVLIEALIARGHAYAADGHVLFAVPSYPAYGRLSRRSRDEQVAGARVEIAPYKKDAADFVLWKPSTADQPGWDSPWGRGRPGWHIECSAMSERYLAPLPFDIHGGGADLKFPHHENEIAQSCCAHGHEDDPAAFARVWIHNGFLTVEGEKMAKSLGNFVTAHQLLERHKGEAIRLALLGAHYRQPLDWSEGAAAQAGKVLDRLYRRLYELREVEAAAQEVPEAVMAALCDDLNTPLAIAALVALLKEEGDNAVLKGRLLAAGEVLGLLAQDPALWLGFENAGGDDEAVSRLLAEREDARKAKNYARADEIRAVLDAMNIVIEDTPAGPQWRRG